MSSDNKHIIINRKTDHLDLTVKSQADKLLLDHRFMYEPMLGNVNEVNLEVNFLDTIFNAPIWVSSMTGGTEKAMLINKNLAKMCSKFGLGMGLGSCRQLLSDNNYLKDFDVRQYIGDRPLFINLGIAQVETLVKENNTFKIKDLQEKLQADGLIVHINPLQEFTQPEGDTLNESPINTIKRLLDKIDTKLIVKEVGQGMGIRSIEELLKLPLVALEFAAFGGTNFSKLEILRNTDTSFDQYSALINIGHTSEEMVGFVNSVNKKQGDKLKCKEIIISGGIKSFLDGHYFTEKIELPSIYGMASELLKYALIGYEELDEYMVKHIEGLKLAKAFLRIKNNKSA